jgi:hypothetical protein
MARVSGTTSQAIFCPAFDPAVPPDEQPSLVTSGARAPPGPHWPRRYSSQAAWQGQEQTRALRPPRAWYREGKAGVSAGAHATSVMGPATRAGCYCNATANAATFRCPAGHRCSTSAYLGLESEALRNPTGQVGAAACQRSFPAGC